MKSILGGAFMALAVAGLLASCAPPALDPAKRQALLQLEHREAENTRAALEGRGVRPARAEEVIARRAGNTGSMSGGKVSFRTYYLPDGTVRAKLVTQRGYYLASGTWVVNDDGTRCITLEAFKGRIRGMFGWTDGVPTGAWTGSNETNCYQVYYEGDYEYWYLVSGPHFLKFGKTRLRAGERVSNVGAAAGDACCRRTQLLKGTWATPSSTSMPSTAQPSVKRAGQGASGHPALRKGGYFASQVLNTSSSSAR